LAQSVSAAPPGNVLALPSTWSGQGSLEELLALTFVISMPGCWGGLRTFWLEDDLDAMVVDNDPPD
jgi:hypothetical protein